MSNTMREILFRGQTRRYGEKLLNVAGDKMPSNWVYGGIFQGPNKSIIYGYNPVEKHVVYTDTVGQYTGLTDKNGVKIFEGDIVKEYKSKDKVKGVVKFGEYQSGINKYADDLGFYVEWTTENFLIQELGYWCRKNMLEVIGNVHDNSELLEGSNK